MTLNYGPVSEVIEWQLLMDGNYRLRNVHGVVGSLRRSGLMQNSVVGNVWISGSLRNDGKRWRRIDKCSGGRRLFLAPHYNL